MEQQRWEGLAFYRAIQQEWDDLPNHTLPPLHDVIEAESLLIPSSDVLIIQKQGVEVFRIEPMEGEVGIVRLTYGRADWTRYLIRGEPMVGKVFEADSEWIKPTVAIQFAAHPDVTWLLDAPYELKARLYARCYPSMHRAREMTFLGISFDGEWAPRELILAASNLIPLLFVLEWLLPSFVTSAGFEDYVRWARQTRHAHSMNANYFIADRLPPFPLAPKDLLDEASGAMLRFATYLAQLCSRAVLESAASPVMLEELYIAYGLLQRWLKIAAQADTQEAAKIVVEFFVDLDRMDWAREYGESL